MFSKHTESNSTTDLAQTLSTPKHFDLNNAYAYESWQKAKLAPYPLSLNNLMVNIEDNQAISKSELQIIRRHCETFNFALYDIGLLDDDNRIPLRIATQLGLTISDQHLCGDKVGISAIKVGKKRAPGEYIPYTNKPINWHTDGYYNQSNQKILSMILHCAQNAMSGGENGFFDHEILYILLRNENPEYINALMQEDVMTIPENIQDGHVIREAQTGPVFSVYPWGLHMRYTARTKSIIWKKDPIVKQAVEKIREILNSDSIYNIAHQFSPGQGVISNNVLHMRTAFEDSDTAKQQRLIYRMRFYERMSGV